MQCNVSMYHYIKGGRWKVLPYFSMFHILALISWKASKNDIKKWIIFLATFVYQKLIEF